MQLYVPLSMPGLPGIKEIKKKGKRGHIYVGCYHKILSVCGGGEEMVRPLVSLKVAQAA